MCQPEDPTSQCKASAGLPYPAQAWSEMTGWVVIGGVVSIYKL